MEVVLLLVIQLRQVLLSAARVLKSMQVEVERRMQEGKTGHGEASVALLGSMSTGAGRRSFGRVVVGDLVRRSRVRRDLSTTSFGH
jgi:hypothetical protein